ncbi:hypothetical protein DN069_01025 [Streptacidiphilus pinicola]|uniref:Uncharacterized protein n=1 Tax=Streptacidiphilus pinicola TaxID=2219663 RepID=A0A2X0KLA9_9ACTN|nr:hypothetical protein [Streptacidiphilus pinicola]RAG87450.1 hypothetical protein DN069_01025 [Streptacidiphilus pinicola]
MRIQITAVEPRGAHTWVVFVTDVGEGCGWWRSSGPPVLGGQWHAELEFPDPVHEFFVCDTAAPASLALGGDLMTVTAHVVAVDDNVTTLSLGGDVVLLEMAARPGDCVTFAARAIDVYPYEL